MNESEWTTRKQRIDARLRALTPPWDITPSLLARAFRGHLVPQDPTDEPAGTMLERIHAQSESKSRRDARKQPGGSALEHRARTRFSVSFKNQIPTRHEKAIAPLS